MSSSGELVPRASRKTVVCAVPISPAIREELAALLGNVHIVDIRDSVEVADVVLAPSTSPQTIAALQRAYPTARVIVVELEDDERGIELGGPVMRLRRAGADGYLAADSIEDLAQQLTDGHSRRPPLPSDDEAADVSEAVDARVAELTESHLDDLVLRRLEEIQAQRASVAHQPADGRTDL